VDIEGSAFSVEICHTIYLHAKAYEFSGAGLFGSSVQFFTLNLETSDKTKSRGVDCDMGWL